jgi:uncharacterized protein (TIGR04168 family)
VTPEGCRLIVVGDVHDQWTAEDVAWIDAERADAVLFVGDLPTMWHRQLLDVAARVSALRTPALLVPGNHDGPAPTTLVVDALTAGRRSLGDARRHAQRMDQLRAALQPVQLVGYSTHAVGSHAIVACRPHGMDGRRASFGPFLRQRFGVVDLSSSAARLRRLVRGVPEGRPIVFLAHNGPAGLGAGGPWGVGGRDLGDPDLTAAVEFARERGHAVPAVLAGHVHHRGDAGRRRWWVRADGTAYVNAARSPRIEGGQHYAVGLELVDGVAEVRELRRSVTGG